MDITLTRLAKTDFTNVAPELFRILHANMSQIAPTGNSYETDLVCWLDAFGSSFSECESRHIILVKSADRILGYFCCSTDASTLFMEEIELEPSLHGSGCFRRIYELVTSELPESIEYVEACANKRNAKSLAILAHLGLKPIGTNKSGTSYRLRGRYSDLLAWLGSKP